MVRIKNRNIPFTVRNHRKIAFRFNNSNYWMSFFDNTDAFYCRKDAIKLGSFYGAEDVEFEYKDIIKETIIDVMNDKGTCTLNLYSFRITSVNECRVREYTYYNAEDIFNVERIQTKWWH